MEAVAGGQVHWKSPDGPLVEFKRLPYPLFGSEVTIALGTFMGVNAQGAKSIAPSIKR